MMYQIISLDTLSLQTVICQIYLHKRWRTTTKQTIGVLVSGQCRGVDRTWTGGLGGSPKHAWALEGSQLGWGEGHGLGPGAALPMPPCPGTELQEF